MILRSLVSNTLATHHSNILATHYQHISNTLATHTRFSCLRSQQMILRSLDPERACASSSKILMLDINIQYMCVCVRACLSACLSVCVVYPYLLSISIYLYLCLSIYFPLHGQPGAGVLMLHHVQDKIARFFFHFLLFLYLVTAS